MRKFLPGLALFFCTLLTAFNAAAQIQQGHLLVGGDISNLNLKLDKDRVFSMRIDPKMAWFIRNGVALGAYITFDLATARNAGTSVDYGLGALARYYVSASDAPLVGRGRFFFEGTAGFEGANPVSGDNTNGLGLSVGPGWAYFLTPNIGLETLLKYRVIAGFGSRPATSNLNLSLGFQIYLPPSRMRATTEGERR